MKALNEFENKTGLILETLDFSVKPDKTLEEIGKAIEGTVLTSVGPILDKMFGEKNVKGSFSPQYHYMINHKGKKIVLISKKYVSGAELIVDDNIAVGYM